MTDGYQIFNVRTHLGACRTHEGGSGTCSTRGSNPGLSDLNPDALTTEARAPVYKTVACLSVYLVFGGREGWSPESHLRTARESDS